MLNQENICHLTLSINADEGVQHHTFIISLVINIYQQYFRESVECSFHIWILKKDTSNNVVIFHPRVCRDE